MNTSSIEKSIKEETDRICKLTEKIISENKNNLVYDVSIDSYGADKSWETLDTVSGTYREFTIYKTFHDIIASLMTDKIRMYLNQYPGDAEIVSLFKDMESIKNTSKLNLCPKMTQYQFSIVCNLIIYEVCPHAAPAWPDITLGSSKYITCDTPYMPPTYPDNIPEHDPTLASMRDKKNRRILNNIDVAFMTGYKLIKGYSSLVDMSQLQSGYTFRMFYPKYALCENRCATVMFGENSKIILGVDKNNLKKIPLDIMDDIATEPSSEFLMDYTDTSYVADKNGNPVTHYVFPEAANAEWDGIFTVPFTWYNLFKAVAETAFGWIRTPDMKAFFLHEWDTDLLGHVFAGRRGHKFALRDFYKESGVSMDINENTKIKVVSK